jgi:hypothetical protein
MYPRPGTQSIHSLFTPGAKARSNKASMPRPPIHHSIIVFAAFFTTQL